MVPLPLFKIAALFVRHLSKYGANQIKHQAHVHPRFRAFAARYGQKMHQLNMRLEVLVKRNPEAEAKAKEKLETPTVKTEDQIKKEEEIRAKYGTTAKESHSSRILPQSVWKRKFRELPEAKAVDLFADVVGDAFILIIASCLIIYEYYRQAQKPDANKERLEQLVKEVAARFEELEKKAREVEERAEKRVETIETVLREFKDPKTRKALLPSPTA